MGWGQDGLHKRGEKGIYHMCWRDERGCQREKSTRTSNYVEARKFQRDELQRIGKGQIPTEMADWTLRHSVEKYLEWRRASASRKTVAVETTLLRQVMNIFGGETLLRDIDEHGLRKYQAIRASTVNQTGHPQHHCDCERASDSREVSRSVFRGRVVGNGAMMSEMACFQ